MYGTPDDFRNCNRNRRGAVVNTGFRVGLKYSGSSVQLGATEVWWTFATEVMKSAMANRFDVNNMDWFDISLNALTSGQGGRYKLALQVAAKTANSLIDIKQSGGLQTAFDTKSMQSVKLDLEVNDMKIMNGVSS